MSWRQVEERKSQIPPSVTLPQRIVRHVRAQPLSTMPVIAEELRVPLAHVSPAISRLLADGAIEGVNHNGIPYSELPA